MKHLSLCLTVVLLGGMPLAAAAALDYGPNQPLLAADANAPQLPAAPGQDTASGSIPKPDVAAADADAATNPGPDATHRAHPAVPSGSMSSRAHARTAQPADKPPQPPTSAAPQQSGHTQSAWQSLLPGSIQ